MRYTKPPVGPLLTNGLENPFNISTPANGVNFADQYSHEHGNLSAGKIRMLQSNNISKVLQTLTDPEKHQSRGLLHNNGLLDVDTETHDIAKHNSSTKIQKILSSGPILNNETPDTISLKHYNEQIAGNKQLLKRNSKRMFHHQGNHSIHIDSISKNNTNLLINVSHAESHTNRKINPSNIVIYTEINRNKFPTLSTNLTKNIPSMETQELKMQKLETIPLSNLHGSTVVPLEFAVNSQTSSKNCTTPEHGIVAHWEAVDEENHANSAKSYSSKQPVRQIDLVEHATQATIPSLNQPIGEKNAHVEFKSIKNIVPVSIDSRPFFESSKVIYEPDQKSNTLNGSIPLTTTSISSQSDNSKERKSMRRNNFSSRSKHFQNHNSTLNIYTHNKTDSSESIFRLQQPLSITNGTKNVDRSNSSEKSTIDNKEIDKKYYDTPLKVSNASNANEKSKLTNKVNIINSSVDSIFEIEPSDHKDTIFQDLDASKIVQNQTTKTQRTINIKPYNLTLKIDKVHPLSPLENLFNLTKNENLRNGIDAHHQSTPNEYDKIVHEGLTNTTMIPQLRKNFRNRLLKVHNGTRPRFSVKDHKTKVSHSSPINSTFPIKYGGNRYKYLPMNLHGKILPIMLTDSSNTSVRVSETNVKLDNVRQKMNSFSLPRNKPINPIFESNKSNNTLRNHFTNESLSMIQNKLRSNIIVRPLQIARKMTNNSKSGITTGYMSSIKKLNLAKPINKSNFFNSTDQIDEKNNGRFTSVNPTGTVASTSDINSFIDKTSEKLVMHKNLDEGDIFSQASQNVADLTDSASTLYDQPGMFKALSTPRISNSHNPTKDMIVDTPWDQPSLPIESFFRDMNIDT